MRYEFMYGKLLESDIFKNPFSQFGKWFEDAVAARIKTPGAMTLATEAQGLPDARTVLLKSFDNAGFVFCTNLTSNKSKQLSTNNNACLLFFWDTLERQIRINGKVDILSNKEADQCFADRPRASKIGAWCSNQSKPIENREILEHRFKELEEKFEGKEIFRPENWGGYRLTPDSFEFWQGRENRLHDRLKFTQLHNSEWNIERLSP